jgi:hypothetical protein
MVVALVEVMVVVVVEVVEVSAGPEWYPHTVVGRRSPLNDENEVV